MATIRLRPTGYTGSSGSVSNPTNAYDGNVATVASYTATVATGTLKPRGGRTATSYVYYTFNLSSIPQNVIITSAKLSSYCYRTITAGVMSGGTLSQSSTSSLGLYDNTTSVVTTAINASNTSQALRAYTFSETAIETWFASSSPRVRAYSYSIMQNSNTKTSGNVTTGRTTVLRIADIYIDVEYEEPQTGPKARNKLSSGWIQNSIRIKKNGEIVTPTEAYVKINGLWRPIS